MISLTHSICQLPVHFKQSCLWELLFSLPQALLSCFSVDGPLYFNNDTDEFFRCLFQEHVSTAWRLFIDSSKRSLKAVVLHRSNKKPSILIGHSEHMNECYENMQVLLSDIKYANYSCKLCGDLKMVGMLMGIHSGFTKYCCFLMLMGQSWNYQAIYIIRVSFAKGIWIWSF